MTERNRVLLPTQVELLMHSYYSPEPHPEADEIGMSIAAKRLLELDLVRMTTEPHNYAVTKRGEAYCEALLCMQLPEQAWIIGDEILTRG